MPILYRTDVGRDWSIIQSCVTLCARAAPPARKIPEKTSAIKCFFPINQKIFWICRIRILHFTDCFQKIFILFAGFKFPPFLYIEIAQFSSTLLVDNSWILLLFIFASGWYNFTTIERENEPESSPTFHSKRTPASGGASSSFLLRNTWRWLCNSAAWMSCVFLFLLISSKPHWQIPAALL